MTKRTQDPAYAERAKKTEIAKIHIAKTQLAWDDATYRDILKRFGGVDSSKDLSPLARQQVLQHAKVCGFKETKGKSAYPGRPHNIDSNPQLKKIEALLTVQRKPWSYADAIAAKMFKKDRLAFCDATQLSAVIAALTKQGDD